MNMYTLESLKEINNRFCRSHEMTEYDVEKANEYVELIENSRSKLESKIYRLRREQHGFNRI